VSVDTERAQRWLAAAVGTGAAVAAFLLASPIINEDGVQYLDMADAWRTGQWSTALNTYWSPLYSWALAFVLAVARPAPPNELLVVRVVNVVVFAIVLLLWLSLLRRLTGNEARADSRVRTSSWWMLASVLASWVMLQTMGIEAATPDLIATALLLLTALLLTRLRETDARAVDGLVLGLLVGSAVLARAALVTLVPIAVLLLRARVPRASQSRTMLAFMLGVVCTFGVFVTALSHDEQRWTLGDTGRLNYAWFVNGATRYVHWEGEPPGSGVAVHPTRVAREPDVFVFDRPWPCTFPPACDPAYWHEGLRLHFDASEQWAASRWVLDQWRWLVVERLAGVPLAVLVLALLVDRRALAGSGALTCLALAAGASVSYLGVYSEARHVAGALLLVLAPALAALRRPGNVARFGTAALLLLVAALSIRFIQSGWQRRQYQGALPHPQWAIAQELARAGVPAGSRVARIGEAPGTYWARLAGLRLIAEIPAADKFWRASADLQAARLQHLEAAGARAVVADGRDISEPRGWIRVAGAPWVVVRTVDR
jgi:hypothetical protein